MSWFYYILIILYFVGRSENGIVNGLAGKLLIIGQTGLEIEEEMFTHPQSAASA